MGDIIKISGLEVPVFIGVPDEERAEAQKVKFFIELDAGSFTTAAQMDSAMHVVNYHEVAEAVRQVATQRPRKLLETLVEEVAGEILRRFRVDAVMVEIHKYILPDTEHVAVRVVRNRGGRRA